MLARIDGVRDPRDGPPMGSCWRGRAEALRAGWFGAGHGQPRTYLTARTHAGTWPAVTRHGRRAWPAIVAARAAGLPLKLNNRGDAGRETTTKLIDLIEFARLHWRRGSGSSNTWTLVGATGWSAEAGSFSQREMLEVLSASLRPRVNSCHHRRPQRPRLSASGWRMALTFGHPSRRPTAPLLPFPADRSPPDG